MRKIRNLILLAILLVTLACPVFAAGGTITVFKPTTAQVNDKIIPNNPNGSKVYTYYSSDGKPLWQATIQGQFRRTPTGVRCVETVCNVEIFDSRWYIVSKDTAAYGPRATGEVVMGRRFLGIPVDQETVRMSLNSDWYGTLR